MLLLGATEALEKDKAKGESQRASLATYKYSHILHPGRRKAGGWGQTGRPVSRPLPLPRQWMGLAWPRRPVAELGRSS